MRVLIACEFSGVVRDAFIRQGHDAVSCDLLPTESPGPHYQEDIFHVLTKTMYQWDLMIAHPPCTYLANSGVSWLHKQEGRFQKMFEGAMFFKALLDADIPRVAIENPIMHKYAIEIIGRRQDQVIQPWMFGHPESKKTCLWLKGLPKLSPTHIMRIHTKNIPKEEAQKNHYLFGKFKGEELRKQRSITYLGIAEAMADQWGNLEELN